MSWQVNDQAQPQLRHKGSSDRTEISNPFSPAVQVLQEVLPPSCRTRCTRLVSESAEAVACRLPTSLVDNNPALGKFEVRSSPLGEALSTDRKTHELPAVYSHHSRCTQ